MLWGQAGIKMKMFRKKISRIRTGGQSGVDRAAMDFAREFSIPLCGWCPKDGWAEDYPIAPGLLTDYPELTETPVEALSLLPKPNKANITGRNFFIGEIIPKNDDLF